MSGPEDFETHPRGTVAALEDKIAKLQNDRDLLMDFYGCTEEKFIGIQRLNEITLEPTG